MQSKFQQFKTDFEAQLHTVADRLKLEELRTQFLGRKGKLAELMKEMGLLAQDQRQVLGAVANEVKTAVEAAFAQKETTVRAQEDAAAAQREWIDVTEPGSWPRAGHLHPVSTAIAEISDIFSRIGFSRVRAPEVDWDYYAFESLNMPKDHPARDDWETFFVKQAAGSRQQAAGTEDERIHHELQAASRPLPASPDMGRLVLTPHTSNSQVREMEKGKLPIRMININRTYRRQSDVTHVPMFHQFEGLLIDKDVTIGNLKGTLDYFAKAYFGPSRVTRLRPHHFRFTEPSFEIDISCGLCEGKDSAMCRLCKAGWLELGGAGMVHPNVLKAGGVDPKVHGGFAFGWGVERTLSMKSGMNLDDIRLLYKNDLRFVRQF
ncbi:phenylalanine--tRNA ligase subunit alpha [Candidatus Uhrbacteria bacterium]|nr:phenylalanine--tRNA ligase subunit alpha [Candidatus Uhrbacteria bacterium]